jgi:hypothetical protein
MMMETQTITHVAMLVQEDALITQLRKEQERLIYLLSCDDLTGALNALLN